MGQEIDTCCVGVWCCHLLTRSTVTCSRPQPATRTSPSTALLRLGDAMKTFFCGHYFPQRACRLHRSCHHRRSYSPKCSSCECHGNREIYLEGTVPFVGVTLGKLPRALQRRQTIRVILLSRISSHFYPTRTWAAVCRSRRSASCAGHSAFDSVRRELARKIKPVFLSTR